MENLELFRQEVREWLEENCPPSMRTPLVPEEEVWGGRNAEYVNPESKLWLDRMGAKAGLLQNFQQNMVEVVLIETKQKYCIKSFLKLRLDLR